MWGVRFTFTISEQRLQSLGETLLRALERGKLPNGPPGVLLQPPTLRAWKQTLTNTVTQTKPSLWMDNRTGFVHPFEMGPNYVWLISEALCPNRRETREMARKHFVYKKANEVFRGHSFAWSWSKTEIFNSRSFSCFPIPPTPFFLKYV